MRARLRPGVFAKGCARVVCIDSRGVAIELAKANFSQQGLDGDLRIANGACLPVCRARAIWSTRTRRGSTPPIPVAWLKNVAGWLKPAAKPFFSGVQPELVLNALSKLMKVDLDHDRCPLCCSVQASGMPPLLQGSAR